jgi:hypothetical protein
MLGISRVVEVQMWDDLTDTTVPQFDSHSFSSTKPQTRIIKPPSRERNYRTGSSSISKGAGVRSIIDDNHSYTSRSVGQNTVRVDLLNDHLSEHRTSSVLRKKQLCFEYQSLRNSVENSYKSYRSKKKPADLILTARYLEWTSWFKKRYSTDPTTKLTKREFEKLWSFFNQLSHSIKDQKVSSSHQGHPAPAHRSQNGNGNGVHLEVIVEAFVEYGVFDSRHEAMKLLTSIDTDSSQTITFLEFMDGINTSNVSQTLQLRYFISSLVHCRSKNSIAQSHRHEGNNVLGAFSNAVLKTRLRRNSTSSKLRGDAATAADSQGQQEQELQLEKEEEEGSVRERRKSTRSIQGKDQGNGRGGGVEVGSSLESSPKPSSAHSPSPGSVHVPSVSVPSSEPKQSYSQSNPHPLSSRLRAISSRMANPNRVYVQNHP